MVFENRRRELPRRELALYFFVSIFGRALDRLAAGPKHAAEARRDFWTRLRAGVSSQPVAERAYRGSTVGLFLLTVPEPFAFLRLIFRDLVRRLIIPDAPSQQLRGDPSFSEALRRSQGTAAQNDSRGATHSRR